MATLAVETEQHLTGNGLWSAQGNCNEKRPEFYEFPEFVLTTEDGFKYYIERKEYGEVMFYVGEGLDNLWFASPCGEPYLSKIELPSGDEVQFNVNHYSLQIEDVEYYQKGEPDNPVEAIGIEYDIHGHIKEIWGPSEQGGSCPTLKYDYDDYGNLIKVRRLVNKYAAGGPKYETTTYIYGSEHDINDIKDSRGITPIRYVYDSNDADRLTAIYDGRGNYIAIDHDINSRTEVVTDRCGNVMVYGYDERGRVLSETRYIDSNEPVTTTYDYNDPNYADKPSSITDPCDNTTYYRYDDAGRTKEVNDPEGNITKYDYDDIGNVLETSQYRPDPNGGDPKLVSKTVNEYYQDYYEPTNLLKSVTVQDACGVALDRTEYAYDGQNRLTDVNKVDPTGIMPDIFTSYWYSEVESNSADQPYSISEPYYEGGSPVYNRYFAYDDNGNQVKSWYDWVDANDASNYCTVSTITKYDDAGRVVETRREVTDTSGSVEPSVVILSRTTYNGIGKPDAVEGEHLPGLNGMLTVYEYDEAGSLVETRVYDPCDILLTVSRTLYDAEGRVLVTVGPYDPSDANTAPVGTETVYDSLGRVVETRRWADVDVNMVDLVADGNVVGMKVADGAIPGNAWNDPNDPPAGLNIGWTCDGGSLPVVGDELSYTITEYDLVGRVKMTITLDEDGYEWPTSYEYDASGKQTAVIDPCGHDIVWDVNGKIVTADVNSFKGHRTQTQYLGMRRWKVTDPCDNTTEFKYDALGRTVKTIYPSVAVHGPTYSHVAYDGLGRRWWQSEQTVYSDGNEPNIIGREFEYDAAGRLTAVVLPDVNDPQDNNTPARPRYEYDYDTYGNLVEIRDKLKQNPLDPNDVNDSYQRTTRFTYDQLHNQTSRRLPDGRTEYWRYDEYRRVKLHIDFKGQVTSFEYNGRGLLEFKKFYADESLYTSDDPNMLYEFGYDNLGRKTAVEVNDLDAASVETYSYDYDTEGRVTEVNTPQGTVYYDYNDLTGRKDSTWTDMTEVEYEYDELGRLNATKAIKRRGLEIPEEVTTYYYTSAGSRDGQTYANDATTDYQYDALNRLTSLTHLNSSGELLGSYKYTLNPNGMRGGVSEQLVAGGGTAGTPDEDNIITYTYDNLNRLTKEHGDANGTSDYYQTDYDYDVVGNRLQRIVTVDNAAESRSMLTVYDYDDANDVLVSETHSILSASVPLDGWPRTVYASLSNGRVRYKLSASGKTISTFRAYLMGLPTEWSQYALVIALVLVLAAFLLPAGIELVLRLRGRSPPGRYNHLSLLGRCVAVMLAYMMLAGPGVIDTLAQESSLYGRLSTDDWGQAGSQSNYYYDKNGSLIRKETTGPGAETVTYDYNLQNRLERTIRSYTVDGNDVNEVTEYMYNPEGIRVQSYYYKTVNGGAKQDEETKIFLIDAYNHTGYAQVLEEWDEGDSDPDTTYTIGDEVITEKPPGSHARWHLLRDGHGSVRQVMLHAEFIEAAYSYDAYGNMLSGNPTRSSPAVGSLLYAGEYYDNDLQQYYNRARYYDQNTGRFNRMDPFAGSPQDPQSLHKYLYCHANPINNMDSSGNAINLGGGFILNLTVQMGIRALIAAVVMGSLSVVFAKLRGATWGQALWYGLQTAAITGLVFISPLFAWGLLAITPLLIGLGIYVGDVTREDVPEIAAYIAAGIALMVLFKTPQYKVWEAKTAIRLKLPKALKNLRTGNSINPDRNIKWRNACNSGNKTAQGSLIHAELADILRAENMTNLKIEVSYDPSGEIVRYGKSGSVRLDYGVYHDEMLIKDFELKPGDVIDGSWLQKASQYTKLSQEDFEAISYGGH